jgi:hypothetical protein
MENEKLRELLSILSRDFHSFFFYRKFSVFVCCVCIQCSVIHLISLVQDAKPKQSSADARAAGRQKKFSTLIEF